MQTLENRKSLNRAGGGGGIEKVLQACRFGNRWEVIHMRGNCSGADDAWSHDSEYKIK